MHLRLTMNGRLRGNRTPNRRTDVPVDATLKLAVRDRKFTVSAEPVDVLGGHATAALEGTLDASDLLRSTISGTLQVRANAEGTDWGAMVRAGWIDAAPAVRGDAAADFRVSGTAGAPLLDGDVDATVRYESMPAATVRAHASLSADAVGLSGIDARMGAAAARGDVRWSMASSEVAGALNGSVPLQALDDFSPSIPKSLALNGSVNLAATLSGTIVQPRVALHAAGRALEISGQTIDSLAADVRVRRIRSGPRAHPRATGRGPHRSRRHVQPHAPAPTRRTRLPPTCRCIRSSRSMERQTHRWPAD